MLKLSDPVIYVDPFGVVRGAILTTIWDRGQNGRGDSHNNTVESDADAPCVNLVFTSGDDNRTDNAGAGRQIERASSVVHMRMQSAHGNYWRRLDEQGKETER